MPTAGPQFGYRGQMTKQAYSNSLGACMKIAGLTDPQLAERVGTTKQTIFKLRHGERKLTVQWAKKLAPHLGMNWERLVQDPRLNDDHRRDAVLAAFDSVSEDGRDLLYRVARTLRPD